jgi:hypothetical protein
MIAQREMRLFAEDCLRWSDETENPSHRDLMIQVARMWLKTAATIDRRIQVGDEFEIPDFKNKLD